MTKIPSVEERVAEFEKKFVYHVVLGSTMNDGKAMRFNLTPELAIAWLRKALTAEREAGAKEVLQELRDIFKDTHEVGTNHLNSELDRLENK